MKKILKIDGAKVLGKKEQIKIMGGYGSSFNCCGPNKCRVNFPGGSFCEPGRCTSNGGCIFY
ncbi:hypothetical protein [Spongiimicrobium salis]|uniref:hypothetical protein n=1 Tax=Spongiimicrobium salis TaxID=1667022 RepID=UPI00374C9D76